MSYRLREFRPLNLTPPVLGEKTASIMPNSMQRWEGSDRNISASTEGAGSIVSCPCLDFNLKLESSTNTEDFTPILTGIGMNWSDGYAVWLMKCWSSVCENTTSPIVDQSPGLAQLIVFKSSVGRGIYGLMIRAIIMSSCRTLACTSFRGRPRTPRAQAASKRERVTVSGSILQLLCSKMACNCDSCSDSVNHESPMLRPVSCTDLVINSTR